MNKPAGRVRKAFFPDPATIIEKLRTDPLTPEHA